METIKKVNCCFWILICLIGLSAVQIDALIDCNGIGNGYCDPFKNSACPAKPSIDGALTSAGFDLIDTAVEKIGTSTLKANSTYLLILSKVEASRIEGLNNTELLLLLNDTETHLANSLNYYRLLLKRADSVAYDYSFIQSLSEFDYKGYREKYGLNAMIFNEVRSFLEKGDLTGLLYYNQFRLQNILTWVRKLKMSIITTGSPSLELIWKINEKFSENNLFGQYAARIFMSVTYQDKVDGILTDTNHE